LAGAQKMASGKCVLIPGDGKVIIQMVMKADM
jgi:hypothetical protein